MIINTITQIRDNTENVTEDQLCSIMRLSRQFQACLFFFFFDEKISRAQKHVTLEIKRLEIKQA